MTFTIAEVAQQLGGDVLGDGAQPIKGFAPADAAKAGDLTFAENEAYLAKALQTAATAILVPQNFAPETRPDGKTFIRVPDARVAFARVLGLFFPEPKIPAGIHPTAVVAASAQVDPSAHIGPHCAVGERCVLGADVVLHGGNHLGADCRLGDGTQLFPNAVVYARTQIGQRVRIHAGAVIGADGFGYVLDEGVHRKVPQIGHVIIHDDVEIGATSAVDRATLGATVIGKGTKIDNQVQIGHNVVVGEHCIICGQVGIAGSTRVGDHTTVGGQSGLAGHLRIGNRVTIGGGSGVVSDIADGERRLGTPAWPDRETKRVWLMLRQLPELIKKTAQLEKLLGK